MEGSRGVCLTRLIEMSRGVYISSPTEGYRGDKCWTYGVEEMVLFSQYCGGAEMGLLASFMETYGGVI